MRPDPARFIERLKAAKTAEARTEAVMRELEPWGISHLVYARAPVGARAIVFEETSLFGNLPPDYAEVYAREGLVKDDHLADHLLVSDTPARFYDPHVQPRLTAGQLRVERIAWDFGLRCGICFPTRDRINGIVGGLSLIAADMPSRDFDHLVARYRSPLHLMAMALHTEVEKDLVSPAARPALTAGETECLRWAAAGRTSAQTAERLGLAYRTVDHHLEQARQKLGAGNRLHCVARAISLGLIEP